MTRTTCPYCGVGCGVEVTQENGVCRVAGDKTHPANFGLLCSKGYALAETLGDENRLTIPTIDNRQASWTDALDRIAHEFKSVIETHGPEAIGFYVSGQLLTEDYYVVNKFVKGYLGTANIDTNSRLCMASSVAGQKRAFGSDTVPGCYEDLELADLVVLVGSNLAWCHPVLLRRIEAAREVNPKQKIVVIDPRATATAQIADLHLPIAGGGECDVLLFAGLLNYLVAADAVDYLWVKEHTNNFLSACTGATVWKPSLVADRTGLSLDKVIEFYQLFLNHEKVVTVFSQGVNQSCRGTDTVNSIINVHLATARIGKPGCGPFSVTGQPNAMGGREVGGLANMLAAHMEIDNKAHRDTVQRFWQSPRIAQTPGYKAVDLFNAVESGQIKALWIMATNPADSMPVGNQVARALAQCPFVVVSDICAETDTVGLASVQLPALAWSEKDGTVTNSERRISRQRSFRTAPALCKPDWWAVCEVAKRLGYGDAFDYKSACEIYAEHAALSGFENSGSRDFDISAHATIGQGDYNAISPYQWPLPASVANDSKRFFGNGGFFTSDKKARFINPVSPEDVNGIAKITTAEGDKNSVLVMLNTGRVRDQWHTMTRTGYVAKLSTHLGEPFIELSEKDACTAGITPASLVDVSSPYGKITLRALISETVPRGIAFSPMHWSNVFASNARVNSVVSARTDPVSGQPALKSQKVMVSASITSSFGLLINTDQPRNLKSLDYWAISPLQCGWKVELAGKETPQQLMEIISDNANGLLRDTDLLTSQDTGQGYYNACWFRGDRLVQAVYIAPHPVLVQRELLSSVLDKHYNKFTDRMSVLSGIISGGGSTGPVVCSCMNVGKNTLKEVISCGANTVAKVGDACGAGTQCGSCRPEIETLLQSSTNTKNAIDTEIGISRVT